MNFDLRIPLGLLFTVLGSILVVIGLFGSPELVEKSLGLNMNLWWGLFQLLFGLSMLILAWRQSKSKS
jgi:hypothetical protein